MVQKQVSEEPSAKSHGLQLRNLPPAGDFASPLSILMAMRELKQTQVRTEVGDGSNLWLNAINSLTSQYPADSVLWTGSGTAALYHLFCVCNKVIPNLEVGVAAYTCPQVVAAALRAGAQVRLFDIDPQTLQILPEELESPPSVLVLSNLYGLPDDVDARLVKCTLVIDDACQAMLSKRKGEYVGCWPGTLGVLSFGRGKALSGLGGGAIVAASLDATVSNAICSVLKELHSLDLSPEALGAGPRCYVSWAYALAYWMFGVPELYWIPAALPFLGLGETAADLDFSVDAPCPLRLAAAVSQLKKWGDYQKKRAETARKWNEVVADVGLSSPLVTRDLDLDGEVVPLRYPVICHDSKQREALFSVLSKAGLGVSKSYPMPVSGFEELRSSKLTVGRTAGAQIVADRILTLPVHGAVSDKDLVKAQRLFKRTLG